MTHASTALLHVVLLALKNRQATAFTTHNRLIRYQRNNINSWCSNKPSKKYHNTRCSREHIIQDHSSHHADAYGRRLCLSMASTASTEKSASHLSSNEVVFSWLYTISGLASSVAWVVVSCISLSYHPDPKFQNCTMRHNILTMSQAFCFPLSVLYAAFASIRAILSKYYIAVNVDENHELAMPTSDFKLINLGVAASSIWLSGAAVLGPIFCFGYDLYPRCVKIGAVLTHALTAFLAILMFGKAGKSITDSSGEEVKSISSEHVNQGNTGARRLIYSSCAAGYLWFTMLPIFSSYPLATVPSILGKRLSRPASAFSFLAAVLSYSLSRVYSRKNIDPSIFDPIRRSMRLGCMLHLGLVLAKIVGVDGGGLLLPGRGLWEVYPAMLAVPFSAGSSMIVHVLFCIASLI